MEINKGLIALFQKNILSWHQESNTRKHPWSKSKEPYRIWLSEIILQQTRIEQGLPYYVRFTEKYPTIFDLAAAKDEEVFLLWQGLGYYNRCRNLLTTARYIVKEKGGIFPKKYVEILKLKGVGSYTAAAISSFAFNLPYAVLDGNVFRLLSRFLGIEIPIDSSNGKKFFQETAQQLLPQKQAAAYNQAVMDFGATICTPTNPRCDICPLSTCCKALALNFVPILPVKEKKIKVRKRNFQYFLLQCGDQIFLQQRNEKDIWQDLFELFLIETDTSFEKNTAWKKLKPFVSNFQKDVFNHHQTLTHQRIESHFHIVNLQNKPPESEKGFWVKANELHNYAFPKTILEFLKTYFSEL